MTHFALPEDRDFRILQITDIHLEADERLPEGEKTFALIRQALKDTSPDLVVITGDIAWARPTDRLWTAWRRSWAAPESPGPRFWATTTGSVWGKTAAGPLPGGFWAGKTAFLSWVRIPWTAAATT